MCIFNLCQIIYVFFSEILVSKKKRDLIQTGIMFILNVCFNSRHIGSGIASSLSKTFLNKIRYLIRKSKINFHLLSLYYEKAMINFMIMLSNHCSLPLYLIIDDTFVDKDKRSQYIVRGGKKKNREGFSLLTALLVVGCVSIPLKVSPCYRKDVSSETGILYTSKIDKAMIYIRIWYYMGLRKIKTYVLLDSWYVSNNMLLLMKELPNMSLIGSLKCNRHVNKCRIDSYIIDKHSSKQVLEGDYKYELFIQTGTLNNVSGNYSVLISRRTNLIRGDITYRYILSSSTTLTESDILYHYRHRWKIEVFHRIFKYRFSLPAWRFHSTVCCIDSMLFLSRLCILCVISLGFAVRNTVKSFDIEQIHNFDLSGDNIISYCLSEIRTTKIFERYKKEMTYE